MRRNLEPCKYVSHFVFVFDFVILSWLILEFFFKIVVFPAAILPSNKILDIFSEIFWYFKAVNDSILIGLKIILLFQMIYISHSIGKPIKTLFISIWHLQNIQNGIYWFLGLSFQNWAHSLVVFTFLHIPLGRFFFKFIVKKPIY